MAARKSGSRGDPSSWVYKAHTAAKHQLLQAYLKRWIPILARRADAMRKPVVRLMLVDAFAGRGRYEGGQPGSPLVMAQLANEVVTYLAGTTVKATVEVDCAYIEPDEGNFSALASEITAAQAKAHPHVILRDPIKSTFAAGIGPLLSDAQRLDAPIFVFIDPYGFGDIPLKTIAQILALPQAEVLITYMVSFVNRFIEQDDRDSAFADLFGMTPEQLVTVRETVARQPDREQFLLDGYMRRLIRVAGAKFTHPFRMNHETGHGTLYYLVHASTNPKAVREMKLAMKSGREHGEYAYFGPDDFAKRSQLRLIKPDDPQLLKVHLLQNYAGQIVEWEKLLDSVVPDPRCYYFDDRSVRRTVNELRKEGKLRVTRLGKDWTNALARGDRVHFPAAPPAVQRQLIV